VVKRGLRFGEDTQCTLKMEAVCSSETPVTFYTKRRKYQETAISQRGEHLTPPKFHIVVYWALIPYSLAGDNHRFRETHRVVW
jgi:hypothetical protein